MMKNGTGTAAGLGLREIAGRTAACGLDCGRCVYAAEGSVRKSAVELQENLRGFEGMAKIAAGMIPALGHYEEFLAVLRFFTEAACDGCRAGGKNCFPGCTAKTCVGEKGIDFCFECAEFPCEKNSYPPSLAERWKANNLNMREKGIETFFREQLGRPRYGS